MNDVLLLPSSDPAAPPWEESLRDRSRVLIRSIVPSDSEAERRFIDGLSATTRRMRFLGQVRALGDSTLERFTHLDPTREVALVAIAETSDRHDIVGIARYCIDREGNRGECAVVVADRWQRKGLGAALMRHLVDQARLHGVGTLYSTDLACNFGMTDLARRFGFRTRPDPDDSSQVLHELSLQGGHPGG